MPEKNHTKVSEFIFLGFGNHHILNVVFFVVFLIIFIFTITGNLLIIVLVSITPVLQSPMYYLLSHLSSSDLLISANILPNMLGSLLREQKVTYYGCITQLYFYCATTLAECFLLSVMSYDRYLAICNPLRYSSIMHIHFCINLSVWPWLLGFTLNLSVVLPISDFDFCADNAIDHFYCDFSPLQKLSCSDTSMVELEVFLFSMPLFIFPCSFIIVTYVNIFNAVLSMSSTTGKKKAFSTCSSHLLVVGTFYGTLTAKYMIPSKGHSLLIDKIVSLLHTVFTPLLNPIIYSLRNQDIRAALISLI